MTAADIVSSVRLSDVYRALTGTAPRRTGHDTWRGPAVWRGGDGQDSVSGNDSRGVWHDFVTDDRGGVLALVQRITGGNRADALRWTADFAGIPLDDRPLRPAERARWAKEKRTRLDALYFADSARQMAEWALEELSPTDPERAVHTALLAALRASPEAEYRSWLEHSPVWAAALVNAGRERNRRLQIGLARYLMAEAAHAA